MNRMINFIRSLFEIPFFGVCSYIGDKLNIPSRYIRLNFVYVSLLTFGSPILIYLIVAFWINLRQKVNKRKPIWDF